MHMNAMPQRHVLLRARAVVALALALTSGSCGARGPAHEAIEATAETADTTIHLPHASLVNGDVRVEELRAQLLADTVVMTGQIEPLPLNIAHISTRVAGTVP